MTPDIARRLILPVHESLLGRKTFAIWRQLEGNSTPTRQQVLQLQQDKLRDFLAHAAKAIPYWSERLSKGVLTPAGKDPTDLLANVPVLTRSEIRRHREEMRWHAAPGKVLTHQSGGTTDDNLTFYWGRSRQSCDRAMRYRGLARHSVFPGDRTLHLWPVYPASSARDVLLQGLRRLRDWLTNDVVVDLRPFGQDRLDAILKFCVRYRPVLLIAYPSWLVALGQRLRSAHSSLRFPTLRLILCTGEVLFDFQRRFLEDTFGVRVVQEYGSQDAGLIAHEDKEGVLRLNAEQMLVEILRDNKPVMPGELGEVVVTHFHTEIMPIIRYATGDIVRQCRALSDAQCGLPQFALPEGRTSDLLVTTVGELCPMRPVVEQLATEAGLWDFNLHQTAPNQVVFRVCSRNGEVTSKRIAAEEILRGFLGNELQIDWRQGRDFVSFKSGKRRYVCSPIALPLIAHDREAGMSLARSWPQRLIEEAAGAP